MQRQAFQQLPRTINWPVRGAARKSAARPGFEPSPTRSRVKHVNHYTTADARGRCRFGRLLKVADKGASLNNIKYLKKASIWMRSLYTTMFLTTQRGIIEAILFTIL